MTPAVHLPTWVNIILAIGGVLGTLGAGNMLGKWLDHKRDKRAQTDNVALTLVGKLEQRVGVLEHALDKERARCEAELGQQRHRINNQRTLIYSLLHIFEMPAGRQAEAIKRVREQLAFLEQAEATEKAIIAAAPLHTPMWPPIEQEEV